MRTDQPVTSDVNSDAVAEPSRVQALADGVRQADFVAMLRYLSALNPELPPQGEALRLKEEVVRLSQHVDLAFAGRELESLTTGKGRHPWRLHCNFQGLLGTNGAMPLHFTEYVLARAEHHKDATLREFVDLFNHRLLSLLYRARTQFDPIINADRPERNSYCLFLGAMAGLADLSSEDSESALGIPENFLRRHGALLAARSRSPDSLVTLVESFFPVTARVDEFIGAWLVLPDSELTKLGDRKQSLALGRGICVGRRVWRSTHRFALCFENCNWSLLQSFRPGSERATALLDLVRHHVGEEFDWDLLIELEPGAKRGMALNRSASLGFDCWLSGSASTRYRTTTARIRHRILAGRGEAAEINSGLSQCH